MYEIRKQGDAHPEEEKVGELADGDGQDDEAGVGAPLVFLLRRPRRCRRLHSGGYKVSECLWVSKLSQGERARWVCAGEVSGDRGPGQMRGGGHAKPTSVTLSCRTWVERLRQTLLMQALSRD